MLHTASGASSAVILLLDQIGTAGTLAVQAKVCQGLQFMFMCHITLLWQATLSAAVSHISSGQEQYCHGMCVL